MEKTQVQSNMDYLFLNLPIFFSFKVELFGFMY